MEICTRIFFAPLLLNQLNIKTLFICLAAFAGASCRKEPSGREVYTQIETGASANTRATFFEIDTLHSVFNWRYTGPDNQDVTGTLRPVLGSLVVENQMVLAGFVEANVLASNISTGSEPKNRSFLHKALHDSVPILYRSGSTLRLDLAQATRNIPKSDFNSGSAFPDSLYGYVLGANLEVVDSTRNVSLPVSLKIGPKQVLITGEYNLIPQEFGIKPLSTVRPGFMDNSRIAIQYRLVFKPLQ